VNSGSYYLDAQVGAMPATERYLEERRTIETDRQRAAVEEARARAAAGVFFPELPQTVTNLSLDDVTLAGGITAGADAASPDEP
jgi:hypothetical protein